MMASQQSKPHDPMYNFDTHFPERLSRLHLHSENAGSFRKKKTRAQRNSARYKTQPVTFDEIKEVDEEPVVEEKLTTDNLKGQLQAFSRSMDGLLPRSVLDHSGHGHFHFHGSHSRSGSRKFHRHPDCIPEKAENEQQPQSPQPNPPTQEVSLNPDPAAAAAKTAATTPASEPPATRLPSIQLPGTDIQNPPSATTESQAASGASSSSQSNLAPEVKSDAILPPVSPTNMASRRQKVTAKAKKRQKASEEGL